MLQPFVENAIWHGIQPNKKDGRIEISLEKLSEDTMRIVIVDDGIGLKKSIERKKDSAKLHESFGIRLVEERMEVLKDELKNKFKLTITDRSDNANAESGTQVELEFPIIEEMSMRTVQNLESYG